MTPPIASRSKAPVLTLALLGLNLLAAFALLLLPGTVERLGFRPDAPSLVGALGSLFLHANVAHLLGNLVFLAAAGTAVELATGWARYLGVYLLSGLAGVGLYWLAVRGLADPAPLIGASGSVAGLVGYYAFRYHALRVLVAPGRALSVAAVTGVWFALQLLGAVLSVGSPVAGVAFFAHLGGFLMGLVLSLVFRAPDVGQRALGHAVLDAMNERGPDAVAEASRAHLSDHPDDPVALARLAGALHDLGEADEEAEIRLRLVRTGGEAERREALARLLELDPKRLSGRHRLQMADAVAEADRPLAGRLLRSVLNDPSEAGNHPDALLALATLSEPPDATLLHRLRADHPLSSAAELARARGLLP